MTDAPSPNAGEPTDGEPSEADPPDLGDLRFVGSATEAVLAEAAIGAPDILDRSVPFVKLVEAGVDPGVAARIRREYSLPWSDEPTRGARLRRRASHVRHLRDDERSWIDASWGADPSTDGPSPASAPDGSGRATDAEQAWRERSQNMSLSEPDIDDGDAAETDTDRPPTDRSTEPDGSMEPPIDPTEFTVPELREAVGLLADPEALAAILRAERAGDGRKTAVDAIEERLEAVGVDPAAIPAGPAARTAGSGSSTASAVRERVDTTAVKEFGAEKLTALSDADVPGRAATLLDEVRESVRRFESGFRRLRPEDWRQLSFATLLGFIVLNLAVALVVALGGAIGPPAGALPLFVVTLVVGVVSCPLHWWDTPGGYHLTLVTGVLGVLVAGLIAAGAVGSVDTGALPITLPVYGLVAAAVLTSTYLSRAPSAS